jgi:hypothetical protein
LAAVSETFFLATASSLAFLAAAAVVSLTSLAFSAAFLFASDGCSAAFFLLAAS